MAKRIPRRVREEAAEGLCMCASGHAGGLGAEAFMKNAIDPGPATELACAAFQYVSDHDIRMPWHLHYAEAEALLRTGWSPP